MADVSEEQYSRGYGGVAVAEQPRKSWGTELTLEQIADRARSLGIRPDLFDEDEYTSEEYEGLLAMYEPTLSNIEEGEIVKARVLRITDKAVILDLGFKSEGAVTRDEFRDPDSLQIGDEVEVFLENLEDEDGVVVLSKKKADFLRVWEQIRVAYEGGHAVHGTLTRKIKGGVIVDVMGVDAFLPGSQIALRRVPNIEDLIGESYDFKIIKLNKRRRNIVVSRRVLLEADREIKRDKLKKELEVGQVRTGVVKNITDFGAFIDLGGMDGLLHITDMSWGRVGHPSEVAGIGDELEVKVLDIDWERERLSLGLKQLQEYPWKDVEKKYPVGARVRGRVVSITNYGAFVELEKGVEGLVHISEMSWTRNVRHPSKIVTLGDEIEAVILKVDLEGEKISLGMKQIEEDPWHALPAKYPVGTRLSGKVRNLTSFGAFVEIEPGIDGLVHISDMSWTKRIQHPSEVVKKGDDIGVVVLGVDAENKRISLGLKQTQEDPWGDIEQQYHVGQEIAGPISRVQDKGVAVDLGNDVEGFVPVSQTGVTGLLDPADVFAEGDVLDLRITEVDANNHRIVCEVVRVPKFDDGEPRFTQLAKSPAPEGGEGDAATAEGTAAEPSALPHVGESPEELRAQITEEYEVGQEVAGFVTELDSSGITVDLGGSVEGFIPVSEFAGTDLENLTDVFVEGDVLDVRIKEVDAANDRIWCELVRMPEFVVQPVSPDEEVRRVDAHLTIIVPDGTESLSPNRDYTLLAGVDFSASPARDAVSEEIVVVVRGEDMTLSPKGAQVLAFSFNKVPAPIEFQIRPMAVGAKTIIAEFYHQRRFLAQAELQIDVAA